MGGPVTSSGPAPGQVQTPPTCRQQPHPRQATREILCTHESERPLQKYVLVRIDTFGGYIPHGMSGLGPLANPVGLPANRKAEAAAVSRSPWATTTNPRPRPPHSLHRFFPCYFAPIPLCYSQRDTEHERQTSWSPRPIVRMWIGQNECARCRSWRAKRKTRWRTGGSRVLWYRMSSRSSFTRKRKADPGVLLLYAKRLPFRFCADCIVLLRLLCETSWRAPLDTTKELI